MILTLVRAARKVAKEAGRTPIEVLEDLIVEKFQNELPDGKGLIQIREATGEADFDILDGMFPANLATLTHDSPGEQALDISTVAT